MVNQPFLGMAVGSAVKYKYKPANKAELIEILKTHKEELKGNLHLVNVEDITDFSWLFASPSHYLTVVDKLEEATDNEKNLNPTGWNNLPNTAYKGIETWDVSKGTTFLAMFAGAGNFNQNIKGWNVKEGVEFTDVLYDTAIRDKYVPANLLEVSPIPYTTHRPESREELVKLLKRLMYAQNMSEENLASIDTSLIFDFTRVFREASATWIPSGNELNGTQWWDMRKAITIEDMFPSGGHKRRYTFNVPIGRWKLWNCTQHDVIPHSRDVTGFNRSIASWVNDTMGDNNPSNTLYFSYVFEHAEAFDQDISGWDERILADVEEDDTPVFGDDCPIREEYKPPKYRKN